MKTIFKYVLKLEPVVHILMPAEAKILAVQEQHRELVMWAEVETDNLDTSRTFIIIGTGQKVTDAIGFHRKYLTSVQQGKYVWHVFEKVRTE